MTTTHPFASDSGLNLDHLEALARAATPGPWSLAKVIDRSIEHLCPVDRDRLSLLTVVHEGETPYGAVFRDEDAKFMAGIHPEQVLALIALARRAQPESEASQAADQLRDKAMAAAEEWANAEFSHANNLSKGGPGAADRCNRAESACRASIEALATPAASLPPLCGAQHAESGKESIRQHEAIEVAVDQCYPKQDSPHASVNDKIGAARLAFRKGYRAALAAQQAAAPGALADDAAEGIELLDTLSANIAESGNYGAEATLLFLSQIRQCFAAPVNSPEIPDGSLINEGTSAPGTPEAPDTRRINMLGNEIVDTIYMDDGRIIDVGGKHAGNLRAALDKFAAQLDGSQGEGQ